METIGSLPRRLTQLYSDTKTSCDLVVEQDKPEPLTEDHALHRKYRIQKDRLIAWGVKWADTTKDKQGDIDESVERAGLTDTVTSVLGTIKDILDEIERMQPPAVHGHGADAKTMFMSSEKTSARGPSQKPSSWAASDRSRYEELAKDLTTSIDTLYDLSNARRPPRDHPSAIITTPLPPGKASIESARPKSAVRSIFSSSEYSASDVTLINPATIPASIASLSPRGNNLPPKLDRSDLDLPQEEPPPDYESVDNSSAIRVIGKLRSQHSSTNPWKTDGSKNIQTPVLVEYAPFDPAYRITQVSPSLDRLESLVSLLSRLSNERSFHSTLNCLGYFEDPNHPRYGIVFELPSFIYSGGSDLEKPLSELQPVTLLNVLQTGSKSQHNSNSATPPLEDRFQLAVALARTFQKFHGDQFVHKDVNSSNILVFKTGTGRRHSTNKRALQYQLRSPYICSFDLFSEFDLEPDSSHKMSSSPNIYRHPEDPKHTGDKEKRHGPQFDLYSLGLILLEIGLWVPLSDLWKPKYSLLDFKQRVEDVYIRRLASKCGTAYMQAVRDCFHAADRIASGIASSQTFLQQYNSILVRLNRCCLLDEGNTNSDLGDPNMGVAPGLVASPLKRKNGNNPIQAAEGPESPSHRAKRWAVEKGAQYLERTRSLSKSIHEVTAPTKASHSPKGSPKPQQSLSRNGSVKSQHSFRKSISHGISGFRSPVDESPQSMDWESQHDADQPSSLDTSGTLVASKILAPALPKTEVSTMHKDRLDEAASVIQRAWRASRSDSQPRSGSMTLKDYKDKITVIQKAWRQKRERTNTVGTLITVANTQMLGYAATPRRNLTEPTPEPEKIQHYKMPQPLDTSFISIQREPEPRARPKLKIQRVQFPKAMVEEWHTQMLPRLERLVERALKNSDETVCIDLLAIGETEEKARPTICVTCSSVARVKAILDQRFRYNQDVYDLKVRRGKIRRSKMNRASRRSKLPHRSAMNTDNHADVQVMNPFHQPRPMCGASIGAFRDQHLPPVSYGGVILVDDEPLGMSVHHLLDAPSEDEDEFDDDDGDISPGTSPNAMLSSARSAGSPWLMGMGSNPGVQMSAESPAEMRMFPLEISDDEESDMEDDGESFDFSSEDDYESDDYSENELADSMASERTIGDIDGIPLGEGEDIKITQPAIDDVDDDFFPNEEDKDDDHLESHELGHVHASSGIRRWTRDGIVHEIDWALLKLKEDRLQPYNVVQGGRRFCDIPNITKDKSSATTTQRNIASKLLDPVTRHNFRPEEDEYPNGVTKLSELAGLNVHCFGRTTGLQEGKVGDMMSSVRIYRRKTFARSWHVAGGFGLGGDSGAWVIQNGTHSVIGHVLAYCPRNRIAYICPMEVLLEDIKRTLGASRIDIPGSTTSTTGVEDVVDGIEGLGIVDSGVELSTIGSASVSASGSSGSPRRSRLDISAALKKGASESEKNELHGFRSKVIKVSQDGNGNGRMVPVP